MRRQKWRKKIYVEKIQNSQNADELLLQFFLYLLFFSYNWLALKINFTSNVKNSRNLLDFLYIFSSKITYKIKIKHKKEVERAFKFNIAWKSYKVSEEPLKLMCCYKWSSWTSKPYILTHNLKIIFKNSNIAQFCANVGVARCHFKIEFKQAIKISLIKFIIQSSKIWVIHCFIQDLIKLLRPDSRKFIEQKTFENKKKLGHVKCITRHSW